MALTNINAHTHTFTFTFSLFIPAAEEFFDREIAAFLAGRAPVGGLRGHNAEHSGPVGERTASESSLYIEMPVVTGVSVTIASCAGPVTACLSTTFSVNALHHPTHSISSFLSSIIASPFIPTPRPPTSSAPC